MLTTITHPADTALETYQGKWRNLWIFRTGKMFGYKWFDSEKEALAGIARSMAAREGTYSFGENGSKFLWSDFITAIPMPVQS